MAASLVYSGTHAYTSGNGFTTASFNASGATFMAVGFAIVAPWAVGTGFSNVTDSTSATWHNLTPQSPGNPYDAEFRWSWANLTGSGTHTVTVSGTTIYPSLVIFAFSGMTASSPFDQENGGQQNIGALSTGSVTPTTNDQIVLVGATHNGTVETFTFDSGFDGNKVNHLSNSGGNACVAVAGSYEIQTTATTRNVSVTPSSSIVMTGRVATFKSADAAATNLKTLNGLAIASVKTINGIAIASVKTRNGIS